jgi:hypothetical protein
MGIMMHEVIKTSSQVLNCKRFRINPAKNKLTKPNKL